MGNGDGGLTFVVAAGFILAAIVVSPLWVVTYLIVMTLVKVLF